MSPFHYGGAQVGTQGTRFRAFSTRAERCALRVFDDRLRPLASHDMEPLGDGLFELTRGDLGPGTLYNFVLDGQEVPDPYARALPHGVHGPALVIAPHRAARMPVRPLSEQVLYELHVGTFSETGSFAGARAHLPYLARLGVTTLELMPLASFAGSRGWGYDGVALYAPQAHYGTPDELRALIDEAHALELSVILDVVYNHFGPAGNYLSSYASEYFTRELPTPWGEAPNFGHPAMRAYVLDNARYWLEEFGFDGFRLDAVHTLVDSSPKHVLKELVEVAHEVAPDVILIGEDDRNDPAIVTETGLDGVWADDFHHQLCVTLTGEQDGYYAAYEPGLAGLVRAIERGWLYDGALFGPSQKARGKPAGDLPGECFVYCIENHDQAGNRALGDRLSARISPDSYALASTVLLFLPMTPLLFMGQEWAASTPFTFFTDHDAELGQKISEGRRAEFAHFRAFADEASRASIPDPQAEDTFARARLDWDERRAAVHVGILALYGELLTLRRRDVVLSSSSRRELSVQAQGDVLVVRRANEHGTRILLANFGRAAVPLSSLVKEPVQVLLSTRAEQDAATLAPSQALIVALTHGAPS